MPIISTPQGFNEEELYIDLEPTFGQSLFLKCEGFNFAGSIKLKAEFVGDDESAFIEAGIPVGGAENGDEDQKMRRQAKLWGGKAGEHYDRCYHQACDNVDNVNRDVLNHYLRALAGTLAHFATSTAELR